MQNSNLDYDVIIVGAGLSGIGTAYHLQTNCPQIRFKIIEGRASIGGTWDLFKYPGIRSDSDMYTFGFSFNAWKNKKSISEGKAILDYMTETVEKFKLNEKIQLNSKLTNAAWDSTNAAWTLKIERADTKTTETNTCHFVAQAIMTMKIHIARIFRTKKHLMEKLFIRNIGILRWIIPTNVSS
jgi:monooxygenase